MPELVLKETGRAIHVPAELLQHALSSGLYETPSGDTRVGVDLGGGQSAQVSLSDLERVQHASGAKLETEQKARELENQTRIEREQGGLGGSIKAAGLGLARGATLGGSDVAARVLGFDTEDIAESRQAHPILSTATEVAGTVLPALIPGGAIAPAGAAAKLGGAVAKKAGAGFVGATLGGAAEGALVGAGSAATELALSEDPLTLERAASTVGSNVLFGAAVGGAGGFVAKAAEKGILKAKNVLENVKVGKGALADSAVVEEIAAARQSIKESDTWLVVEGEGRGALQKAQNTLRHLEGNPKGLAQRPERALDALQRQNKVLREAIEAGTDTAAQLDQQLSGSLAKQIDAASGETLLLKGKLAQRFKDLNNLKGKVPKEGLEVSLDAAAKLRTAIDNGEIQGMRAAALPKMQAALEHGQALEERLVALEATRGAKPGMFGSSVEQAGTGYAVAAMTGLLPGGPIGAVGAVLAPKVAKKVADLVLGRLGMSGAEAAARTAQTVAKILDPAAKATRITPILATKVLASTAYGAPAKERDALKHPSDLVKHYRAREKEILNQVEPGPDGKLTMTAAARQAVGDNLAGVKAVHPLLADHIETVAARKVEHLANKIPKRPDMVAMRIGPDTWHPSNLQIRSFARTMAAVEDPGGVEERVFAGTATPEDAEAYREVYPERFEDFKRQLIEGLPQLRQQLPYSRRVALSIFSGVPVDPAMSPPILRVLQGSYVEEPGTEGGTQAPAAAPQFGSVTKPEPTPAQERAQ